VIKQPLRATQLSAPSDLHRDAASAIKNLCQPQQIFGADGAQEIIVAAAQISISNCLMEVA